MLEITDMTAGYGPVEVLHGISLNVNEGETVAVLGPNGAGKSTLMNTLVGLVRANQGEIRYLGQPIHRMAPEQILERGIALVPEGRRVFSQLTVHENLRMGGYLNPSREDVARKIDEAFSRFPVLKDRRAQLAGTLSGGEQQQLAIARALMSHPKMLLLDEPSLGLAPVIIDVVLDLIGDLKKEGLTILLVEQNIHQALEVSDRVYVMATGTIRMSGDAVRFRETGLDLEKAYLGGEP